MDTKMVIFGIAGVSIAIIMVLLFCLLRTASYADELEEELLRKDGMLDGKD